MKIKNLFEKLERTGESKGAVLGWGRGMGHKGHMFLASSVITHASDLDADPYFVVSRTVGKDDPITPEEKLEIYKKVFPEKGHIFHTATEEMPDLTKVLAKLQELGYDSVTVVVGADQKKALSYVLNYNGKADKQGNVPFSFKELNVISRQETSDPSREEEGPRATPMRDILKDPVASEDEKFAAWRAAMNPELSDEEVRDLMNKASQRMSDFDPKKKGKVAESVGPAEFTKTVLTEVRSIIREMRNDPYIRVLIENAEQDKKSTLKESDNQEEDYYYVVRHQTDKDIELEMPAKMWTGLKPKHATYEEAKAAYEQLKNKNPREKFTVTRHPRTSYIGGSPSQAFPEGVAEGSLNEFAHNAGGEGGNYFQALASAWYNGTFDSGSLEKGIKSQEDVERLLQRGIVCPDGVTRKFDIGYNSNFDGVVISSDDYYEHADHDETDSRTGKPFGPYDYMEFGGEELDESAKWRDPKYKDQLYTQEKPDYNDTREYDRAVWDPKPKGYKGRKKLGGDDGYSNTDPLTKGFGRSGIKHSILDRGKRKGLPSRDQITSLKGSIKDVHGKHTRANLPEQGMAETTGDPKFDKMLKGITGKRQVAKQQKADTKQQARDAFGGMFGGGNPADKLSIRKKGMAESSQQQWRVTVGNKSGTLSHTKVFTGTKEQAIKQAVRRFATTRNPVVHAELADQGVAEGMAPNKRARLDDLIDQYRAATDPEAYYGLDGEYGDPDEIIAQIRQEFGDNVATKVDAGADKMHFGREHRSFSHDPYDWKKSPRVTRSGKINKQDSDAMKRSIKSNLGVAEGEQRMSRAAKGNEKYGKDGMKALAKAGREGASEKQLDAIRDKHDNYNEGWSQKYKSSINCSHPKGFSQKAHCAGKKKNNESIETHVMQKVCEDCGMCETHGDLNEIKKGQKDSNGFTKCWSGYHAAGTKKSATTGKSVRNCVPNESIEEGKIKINIKHPPESAQEKLYKKHQELRKKSGLPDPSEYKKRAAEKQKEIDDMKEAKESEPPKPRNFVAKNAKTAGAGAHKDKKKQEKQGDVKHKAKAIPMDESRWGPARKKYSGI